MASPQPETASPASSDVAGSRKRAIRHFTSQLSLRRQRDKRFGTYFAQDRGWDLLLQLMLARLEGRLTNAAELFGADNPHAVTIEELDRQIGLGHAILVGQADKLESSQIVLSDEAARHMIDLCRIALVGGEVADV